MPAPSATIGRVDTLSPMPTSAITAYTSTDTSASGNTTSSVPTTERKVTRHMTITAANTPARISSSLARTVSLVAAITPTLPAARRIGAPVLYLGHDARDGAGLVVGEEHHDRHDVAVLVQQAGAGLYVARRLRELRLLARDAAPLEAAFVPAGDRHLGDERQRDDVLHTRHVAHVPAEAVDAAHQVVAEAQRLLRLDDRGEHVDADAELGGDHVVVTVVARVGPQLRHARLGIADRGLAPPPPAGHRQQRRERDDGECRPASGHGRQVP